MSDKILIPLSDWVERRAERGRGSGNTIRERFVCAMDNRGFMIGIENGRGTLNPGTKYSSKIQHLVPTAQSMAKVNPRQFFDMLCCKLAEQGHPAYVYDESKSLSENTVAADLFINPFGLYPGKDYVGG